MSKSLTTWEWKELEKRIKEEELEERRQKIISKLIKIIYCKERNK